MQELVEVLRALLGSDNASRNAAERQYESLKKDQPQALVGFLLKILQEPQVELPVREQAAVLLRQCLGKIRATGSIWSRLCIAPSQHDVLSTLLHLLEAEPVDKVRGKVVDCIQCVGNQLILIDDETRPSNASQWPELLPTLMRMIMDASKAPGVRADALRATKEMVGAIWPVLLSSLAQTSQVIRSCLSDEALSVCGYAACLLCELVCFLESKEDRKHFTPLVPDLVDSIRRLAAAGDPTQLKLVLQAVCSSTESTADFYKDYVGTHLLPLLVLVAKSHSDEEARRLALEVLCSMVESKPKMMMKVTGSLEAIFEICVGFLAELDDDVDGWATAQSGSSPDGEEQHTHGAETIDRICCVFHNIESFAQVLKTLQPVIAKLFQQTEWKAVVAGLVMLRQISEYIDDHDVVHHMLLAVRPQLQASHPRVRCAAWGCVLQLGEDQSEVACADEWAAKLLSDFVRGLDDVCSRVVVACMTAFHHYGENVDREHLEPFVQTFMTAFGQKLQGSSAVRREAITSIAVIAQQIQEGFSQYYEALMPVLKQLVAETVHKVEERVLLGKAFECISLLANAVGRDVFRTEAESLMDAMVRASAIPDLPKDDPIQEYVMSAAERICSTLREDFLPFLPHLLPGILAKLALSPKEYDASPENLEDGHVSLEVVAGADGEPRVLVISSSELEDVQHAIECIHTFVEKLAKAYMPFVSQTALALLPVFEFSIKEDIRELAFVTWGRLCSAAREGGQTQVVSELVGEFMRRVLPKLEGPADDLEAMRTRADGVVACLREAGPGVLSNQQVQHICQLSLNLVSASFARRSVFGSKGSRGARGEIADDDTDDDEEGEEAEEELLRQSACNCATAIMTHHPDAFISEGMPLYVPLVQQLVNFSTIPGDRRLGLYIISSLSEHLGEKVVPHWSGFMPRLLQDVCNEDDKIRTPACYAISFVARQDAFGQFALDIATKLAQVISQTRARGCKKAHKPAQMAADNALSALMEILVHHGSALDAAQVPLWTSWVAGLPCQEDEDEGVRNHGMLLQLLEKQRSEVIGVGGANVAKVLSVLVEVYRTPMADDMTSFGIGKLLLSMEAKLEPYTTAFTDKQKKKIIRILRDAKRGVSA